MELQIQDLVNTIKHDGIEEANKKANEILEQANSKAASIIASANDKAAAILSKANDEVEIIKANARVSIEQAQRDAVISFRKEIEKRVQDILTLEIRKTFDGSSLVSLIKAALSGENPEDYSVELENVSESLKSQLASEIRKGLELKVSRNVPYGFRLASKDGSNYFDCSDEEIAMMLKPFLGDFRI